MRKSNLARGIKAKNLVISRRQLSGRSWVRDAWTLKLSMKAQTPLRQPNSCRLNIEKYTRPPQTTCICFCVTHRWLRRDRADATYLSSLLSLGYAMPRSPSTCAPCTSACKLRETAFFKLRGTSHFSYSCLSPSTAAPGTRRCNSL